MTKLFLALLITCGSMLAQVTPLSNNILIKNIPSAVNANYNWLIQWTSGTSIPGTCSVGYAFYKSDSQTWYDCTATNVYTLRGSGSGGVSQVNSDWNAVSGVAQILNKPTIPSLVNPDWNASSGFAQILNKPTIPAAQVNSDWNASSGLAHILNVPSTFLPSAPTTSVLGGVKSLDCTGSGHIVKIDITGTPACSADAGGGSGGGVVTMMTGSGAPGALSCTAPSASVLVMYDDSTNSDLWFCYATNSWKKVLSVTGSGQYTVTGLTGAAISNPSSGNVACYFSSTSNTQVCLDSSGNAFSMVKGLSSATSHNFLTFVDALGIQHYSQPVVADISGLGSLASQSSVLASQLPAPGTSTLGAVNAKDCSGVGHVQKINTDGSITCAADTGGSGGGSPHYLIASYVGTGIGSFNANTVGYITPGSGWNPYIGSDSAVRMLISTATVAQNLCFSTYNGQDASGSLTITVFKNGTASTLVATIPAGTSAGSRFCDTTHTVSLAVNDQISLEIYNHATAASSTYLSVIQMQLQ